MWQCGRCGATFDDHSALESHAHVDHRDRDRTMAPFGSRSAREKPLDATRGEVERDPDAPRGLPRDSPPHSKQGRDREF